MYRNGRSLSSQVLRDVWAAVTIHRRMPIRALARSSGHAPSTTHAALVALRDAGYIDFADNTEHTRTIIVPFIVMKKKGH